jgi:hypothetical protein
LYLYGRSHVYSQFASQETFQDRSDDLGDVLFKAKLLDVIQQLSRDIRTKSSFALFDEGRILFDVGVEVLEGRGV